MPQRMAGYPLTEDTFISGPAGYVNFYFPKLTGVPGPHINSNIHI